MKTFLLWIAISLAFPALLLSQQKSSGAAEFNSIDEVVEGWDAGQHLWTKGSLPLDASRLKELESWLDENAPNWTIVLMQNASGQTYENRQGMDAVEWALGPGLANRAGFANLIDARTEEQNGAVFILFLEERKFSYFASEAFDKRALGEERWVGKLDKPAISAMRNGGNIIGAVKNTVSSVEESLTLRIQKEEQAKRNAEIQRQQAIEKVKLLPTELEESIRETTYRASKLRADHPALSGTVARPETAVWLSNSKAVEEFASAGQVEKATELGEQTKASISLFHENLTKWEESHLEFDALQNKIDTFPRPLEVPSLLGQLAKAEESLISARKNHEIGEPLYANQLEECETAIDQATAELESWQRLIAQQERERKARALRNQILLAFVIILILFGLAMANRATRPHIETAKQLFRKRRRNLRGKFDQLFSLMDRAAVIVGPNSQLSSRGFSGTTFSLAKSAIHEIDELFIMSSATDWVMDRAEKLIHPKSVFAMLENVFSPRKFKKATALLGEKPIGFDREDNLEVILNESTNDTAATRSLLGDPEDYSPFHISFENLIEEFDERREEAEQKVIRLEKGIDGLPLLQERVSGRLSELIARTEQQGQAAADDGLFPLLALRNRLIPAAEASLNEAAEIGQEDPVTALETEGIKAERQVEEGLAIANRIESVRYIDFPAVKNATERLEALNRNAAWVDAGYDEFTGFVEQLSIVAISRSIQKDWEEFEDDIFSFKGRVTNCATLAERIGSEIEPSIEGRVTRIKDVRKEICEKLKVEPDQIFSEKDLSPPERIRLARHELAAARASLDHGNTIAAQENFSEIELTLREVDDLIRISLDSLKNHDTELADLSIRHKSLSEEGSEVAELFDELENAYDPAVMLFATRFGESVRGQQSIRQSLSRARSRLQSANDAMEESEVAFEKAALIKAASLLEKAANDLGFVEHQLGMISDQHKALKKAESKNQTRVAELIARLAELESGIEDRRTVSRTVEKHRFVGESLGAFQRIVSEGQKDPFALFHALAESAGELDFIADGIEADHEQYDQATSAVARAQVALKSAESLISEAKNDRITDSHLLTRAIQNHKSLSVEVDHLREKLKEDHLDWADLFEDANRLSTEALKTRSTIRDEVRAAKEAAAKLDIASDAISSLQAWRSSYSVKARRETGSEDFIQAQHLLEIGDYAGARKAAISSHGSALREKKRIESREAEERRAAQAARRRSLSSSFSSGSSFSSSSSSSSSSGFSSSSFSSSSGFSRSGW